MAVQRGTISEGWPPGAKTVNAYLDSEVAL